MGGHQPIHPGDLSLLCRQVPGQPEETAAALAELPDYLDATVSLPLRGTSPWRNSPGWPDGIRTCGSSGWGVRINDGGSTGQLLPLAGFDAAGLSMRGGGGRGAISLPVAAPPQGEERPRKVYRALLTLLGYRRSRRSWQEKDRRASGGYYRDACAMWRENGAIRTASRLRPAGNAGRPCAARPGSRGGSGSNPSGFPARFES